MGPENGRRPNNPVTSLPKVVPIPKLVEPIRGPRLWYNSKPDVAAIHGTPSTIRHQNSSQTKKYPTVNWLDGTCLSFRPLKCYTQYGDGHT